MFFLYLYNCHGLVKNQGFKLISRRLILFSGKNKIIKEGVCVWEAALLEFANCLA
jgi:hypothetical protein